MSGDETLKRRLESPEPRSDTFKEPRTGSSPAGAVATNGHAANLEVAPGDATVAIVTKEAGLIRENDVIPRTGHVDGTSDLVEAAVAEVTPGQKDTSQVKREPQSYYDLESGKSTDSAALEKVSEDASGPSGMDLVADSPLRTEPAVVSAPAASNAAQAADRDPSAAVLSHAHLAQQAKGDADVREDAGPEPTAADLAALPKSDVLDATVVAVDFERPQANGKRWPPIITERPAQLSYQSKTGLCYDVRMRYHSRLNITPANYVDPHPEDPRRTFRIYKTIAEAGLINDWTLRGSDELGPYMEKIPVVEAAADQLLLVHSQAHLDFIASTQQMSIEQLVSETERGDSIYLNNDSYLAAKLSCGGAIESCRAVLDGRVKNALAVIRPPGHHAEPETPGGFCLFSNVSVAAKVMLRDYPEQVKKIVILDWDVHHGNGTQKAFYDDPRVLYISLHRYEKGHFYPGSTYGGAPMVGDGAGEGYNINIPWDKPGMGDSDYIQAFYKVVMPVCDEFDPDLVIVSAGFDAAHGDAIGGCHVSPNGYGYMTHLMKVLASGKLVVCLEGGYNLDAISASALAVTKVLLNEPPGRISFGAASDSAIETIDEVIQVHSKYWKCLGPHVPEHDVSAAATSNTQSYNNPVFLSLYNVVRSAENRDLSLRFGFASLPIVSDSSSQTLLKEQIIASPDVFTAKKVLIVLHGPASVWAYRDPKTGSIKPTDSVLTSPSYKYVEWAMGHGYSVLDIVVPTDDFTGHFPGYADVADLLSRLWNDTIKYFDAKEVSLVGIGNPAYMGLIYLVGHYDLRDRCDSIIAFVEDVTLKQIVTSFDESLVDWFYKSSLIFTNASHRHWETQVTQKRPRKRQGRVIRTEKDLLHEMVAERFAETIEFIQDSG